MIEQVLKHSFELWKKNLKHVVIYSIISFLFFVVLSTLLCNHYGITDELARLQGKPFKILVEKMQVYIQGLGLEYILVTSGVIGLCVFPLKAGLINVLHKNQQGIKPHTTDLFIAYQGPNFGRIVIYFVIFSVLTELCGLLGFFGVVFKILLAIYSLLVVPIMLLEDKSAGQSIQQALLMNSQHRISIMLLFILGFMINYSGLLLFGFGVLFTWPFSTILCYSLYCIIHQNKSKTS